MELWAAGIALLIIVAGILVLILCREKIHKGLRIAGVCVLGVLFAAVLGYIALTFLFLDSLDSPPLDESTASGKVLSEKQATVEEHKTPVPCTVRLRSSSERSAGIFAGCSFSTESATWVNAGVYYNK